MILAQVIMISEQVTMILAQVATGCQDFGAGAEKRLLPAPQQKRKRLITNHLPQDTGAGP